MNTTTVMPKVAPGQIQDEPSWVSVCTVSELIDGVGVCALVDGKQIAIFKIPSLAVAEEFTLHALGNFDPKGKAYVLSRGVVGDIKNVPVVASPLYKQHYSLLTGYCLEDDTYQVPVYSLKVYKGRVFVGPIQ